MENCTSMIFAKEMKKAGWILFLALVLGPLSILGQNLVVNPSFEIPADSNRLIMPGEYNVSRAKGWTMPTKAQATLYSSIPTIATLNRAMSKWKFMAKDGNNVVGITTYGVIAENKKELREYVQGALNQPLTVGKKYYVTYNVHFHCEGTGNIGVYFSTKQLKTDSSSRLPLYPQVNHKKLIPYGKDWVEVRDSFVAREAYTHFTIGNFFANNETFIESNKLNYHKAYLDNIVIEEQQDSKMASKLLDMMVENTTSTPSATNTQNTSTPMNAGSVSSTNTNTIPTVLKGEILVLDKVWFQFNASDLQTESSAQLNKLVLLMQKRPNMKILVKGHTSSEGGDDYNMKLSETRAQSVKQYLISQGIVSERIASKGFGETQPVATNDTEDGRQRNRRVEFEIMSE
jgi:outer membrane protein OmpA-like peptidoglycan-associated protein